MRYLYQRGKGARRRKVHLTPYSTTTGEPTMEPLCGVRLPFNTTCNWPLGRPLCKRCAKLSADIAYGLRPV